MLTETNPGRPPKKKKGYNKKSVEKNKGRTITRSLGELGGAHMRENARANGGGHTGE